MLRQRRSATRPFEDSEELSKERLKDLMIVRENIGRVRSRATSGVEETLALAEQRVGEFTARYMDERLRIRVIRWQNKILPLVVGWNTDSFDEIDSRLKLIDDLIDRGKQIKTEACTARKPMKAGADTESGSGWPTPKACVLIKECLKTTTEMREAMVAVQARLAIQPLQNFTQDESIEADVRQLDLFNARTIVEDFSRSFGELEAEFAKIDFMMTST